MSFVRKVGRAGVEYTAGFIVLAVIGLIIAIFLCFASFVKEELSSPPQYDDYQVIDQKNEDITTVFRPSMEYWQDYYYEADLKKRITKYGYTITKVEIGPRDGFDYSYIRFYVK